MNYEIFINAIHQKQKLRICYFSQKENKNIYRNCAPLDFWPVRKYKATNCYDYMDEWKDKYYFYDYDWSKWWHPVPKNPEEIISIELLDEKFDPWTIIDINEKKCPRHIKRGRGIYS